jgi:hypothetical protein
MPTIGGRFLLFGFFALATALWVGASNESFFGSPGRQGDDVYFENIAYHLAKGEGIKFDFTDETWRQAYRSANFDGQNDWIFHLRVRGLTTSRSPGFPLLAAAVYRILGYNWFAVRLVMIGLLAGALTLLVCWTARWHGWLAGFMASATLGLDFFVLRTAGQFMTEALGAVVLCVWFCLVVDLCRRGEELSPRRRTSGWLIAGLIYGVGILVRANLNAWLLVGLAAFPLAVVAQALRRRDVRRLLIAGAAFLLGLVVVAGPWWVRNCVVTKAFAPFGTSGSFGMAGAYCDAAYANGGNWNLEIVNDSQRQTLTRPGILSKSLPEQEYEMGQDSTQLAREWIAANRDKLPRLMLKKGISHLGFYRQPPFLMAVNGLLLVGAIVGCATSRSPFGFWVAAIIGVSLLTTMLTWPHYGRYSIPFRPLIHVACAVGTVNFWTWMVRRRVAS